MSNAAIHIESAFEAPVIDLQEQINDGVLQPQTQIPDNLLADLQEQIPYDEDRWIIVGNIDVWKPARSPLTVATYAALYRVSMTGFDEIAHEQHHPLETGFSTTTVGLHLDHGTTHIVNLTVHGEREVSVRDPQTREDHTITAAPGTISVVRTVLDASGSLVSLPHSVHAEKYGSALQQRVQFPFRSQRRNLPA